MQSRPRAGPSLGQGSFPAPREGTGTQQPTVTHEVKGEGDPVPSTTIPQMSLSLEQGWYRVGGEDREDEEGARDTPVQGGGDRLTTLHPKLSSSKQEPGQDLGSKVCPLPSLAHCLPAPQSHVLPWGLHLSAQNSPKNTGYGKKYQGQINTLQVPALAHMHTTTDLAEKPQCGAPSVLTFLPWEPSI